MTASTGSCAGQAESRSRSAAPTPEAAVAAHDGEPSRCIADSMMATSSSRLGPSAYGGRQPDR